MSRSKEQIDSNEEIVEEATVETLETVEEKVEPVKISNNKIETKSVETAVMKVAIEPNKKMGITRYLQLHPTGNKTLDRTLTKMYGNEVHTENEWEKIINDFLYS